MNTPLFVLRKELWNRILLKRAYSQRKLKNLPVPKSALSSTYLHAKLGRIVRDRKLDAVLKASTSAAKEDDEKLAEFESVAAFEYFRRNKAEYSTNFPQVVEKFQTSERQMLDQNRNKMKRRKIFNQRGHETKMEQLPDSPQSQKLIYPLANAETEVDVNVDAKFPEKEPVSERIRENLDRGFYVYSDSFCDQYMHGDTIDLPNDLLTPEQQLRVSQIKGEMEREKHEALIRRRLGSSEPVENVELDRPGQKRGGRHGDLTITSDETLSPADYWKLRYGAADPRIPPSDKTCPGCGARFHCQDTSLPGFLPAELFKQAKPREMREILCRRCYLLVHHNFLLNVSVSPVNYRAILGKLKDLREILVVLVVDMVDFPNSILKGLPELLGEHRALMIVGNKVDLLPPDAQSEYLDHFRKCLSDTVKDLGFQRRFNLLHLGLISAKTGFGIENLITQIQLKWAKRGDIYLVGCTNVGKSSLFNSLLQSDLCKVRATDLIERATTSIWPGTTLNLLKFPVMNPGPLELDRREKRLRWEKKKSLERDEHLFALLQATGDQKYALLQGYVGQTFNKPKVVDRKLPISDGYFIPEPEVEDKETWNPKDPYFRYGNWCYDTPGTVNDDQIINYLTLEELISTVPRSLLMPRTFVVHPGQCLMIAGLARIDCKDISGDQSLVYMTVFCSRELPIHVIRTTNYDSFMEKYGGSPVVKVPSGDKERLSKFPNLEPKSVTTEGLGLKESCSDITLSSTGWVAITGPGGSRMEFDVWTPSAKGIVVRHPSLLPFAVNLRGNRIKGSPEYSVNPMDSKISGPKLKLKQ